MRILVIGALVKSLVNFRGPLLQTMVSAGHSVIACANGHNFVTEEKLKKMRIAYYPIHLSRAGINPIKDLKTFIDIIRVISLVQPDIVLSYTIKPVIYGSLAAQLCSVKACYSLITGLGYVFMESSLFFQRFLRVLVRMFYRLSLKRSRKVFFQNPDDRALFLEKDLVRPNQAVLVNGSGVDLDYFTMSGLPDELVFLMIARLLVDKGVREYVKATEKVKKRFPQTRFLLVGDLDPNPNSVRENELRQWKESGIIEYLGYLDDVRLAIHKCRCYVLPSYREGTPRTVLEAMAIGRPIITTDAPGCRETVILTSEGQLQRKLGERVMRGENGILVRVRDVKALEKAMLNILEAPSLAERMAKRSREIAEEKFDVHKVNAVILNAMGLT